MSRLRIGLLGAARITQRAIIDPVQVMPSIKLAGIAARDQARAETHAKTWGVRTVHSSYQDLIEADDVDLIYNPLPINLHAEWTIKALQAGKHVLCEKPFAMNADEAKAMLAAAEVSGKRLIEAFHYRYHPSFETCLDWIRAGRIGGVQSIEAAFDAPIAYDPNEIRHRIETGGGAMMDLGCYPLSWALMVMDAAPEIVEASAVISKGGVDEAMSASLRFPGGATAKISTSMAMDTSFQAPLIIQGSTGRIEFQNPLAPQGGARLTLETDAGREAAVISPISTYTYQLAAISAALASGDPLPMEGEVILRQQTALDAIYQAAGLRDLRWR